MTSSAEQFPYLQMNSMTGVASLSPYLSMELLLGQSRVSVLGLVDSGAAINVLPYDIGVQLGAIWEHQTTSVQLTGNLAASEARVLILSAVIGTFPPVRLVFAWSRSNSVPIVLGQVNFFLEFEI